MIKKPRKIAPSILSANFANLANDISIVEKAGAGLIHVDVMDGRFVPNITVGPPIVKSIRRTTKLPLDVHLMIEEPALHIDAFANAGADYITVHVEACRHLHKVVQSIKQKNIKAGVSLNPHTPLSSIEEIIEDLDLILIMSVNPGFGGQKFIPNSLGKLKRLQELLASRNLNHVEVEVDGGVSLDNIKEISEAGAELIVAGSAIFHSSDPAKTVREMINLVS